MRWIWLFLALGGAARAQSYGPPQPVLDLDFTRSDTVDPRITVTRAAPTTGFACTTTQTLLTFPNNTAATHLCDEQGNSLGMANYAVTFFQNTWSNDLSQSDWHATNITPTPNQPGIDANGATLLTATANGGTILQTQLESAQYRLLSAFAQCVRCTGAIRMTQDGTHWTRIDGSMNTARFTRVPVGGLLQSVQNPVMGFKMDNTGDQILVTYFNLENDQNASMVGPSPPYLLTSSNFVTRPPDLVTMNLSDIPGLTADRFTVVAKTMRPPWYGQAPIGQAAGIFQIDDGTTTNAVYGFYQSTALIDHANNDWASVATSPSTSLKTRCASVPTNQLSWLTSPYPRSFSVTAYSFDVATGLGITCNNGYASGNEPEVPINGPTAFSAPITRLLIGSNQLIGGSLAGYLQRFQIYNGRLRGGQMASILSRLNPASPARKPSYVSTSDGTGVVLFETGEPIECSLC